MAALIYMYLNSLTVHVGKQFKRKKTHILFRTFWYTMIIIFVNVHTAYSFIKHTVYSYIKHTVHSFIHNAYSFIHFVYSFIHTVHSFIIHTVYSFIKHAVYSFIHIYSRCTARSQFRTNTRLCDMWPAQQATN